MLHFFIIIALGIMSLLAIALADGKKKQHPGTARHYAPNIYHRGDEAVYVRKVLQHSVHPPTTRQYSFIEHDWGTGSWQVVR
jgi:hypothetical protein